MSTTITGLPNASTPLDGTERVPMDQAGATVDATTQAIADLAPGTDLSYTSSTRVLSSSTGDDVTLPLAGAEAGLMAAADKAKLDGIADGAEANVNADWAASSGDAVILNKPALGTAAAAATTDFATAAQGSLADTAIQPGDPALTDAREWTASTIGQEEAEAGTATTRRAFTAQRVFQAVAAWWAASNAKTKLDGIAAGATVNSSDATLLNRANHTGTQGAGTITGLASVATSGAYSDLSGTPTLGTAAAANTGDFATAAQGALADSAVQPGDLTTVTTAAAGLAPATSFAAINYAASVALDMAALNGQYRTISLTGDLELTTANRAAGQTLVLRLIADGTERTLTFPVGWVFVGTKPSTIAASKTGVLSLTFFGTADTDCVAAWGVQS